MSNDHWLARIELTEARALAAEAERDRYREALEHVRPDHFIVFATRCYCGFDNCPVTAALDGEG